MYKIIRFYFGGRKVATSPMTVTIERGLTLEQAQVHCQNPETSSSTATSAKAKRRTKLRGPWFDGYREM